MAENTPGSTPPPVNRGDERKKSNTRIGILIGVIIVLLGINIAQWLMDRSEDEKLEGEITELSEERSDLRGQLDKISKELDMKIEETRRLGGDVEELQAAKEQLEQEKEQLRRASNAQISRLREKVTGYEELLVRQDKEIARLKEINEELLSENTSLKDVQNQLSDSITTIRQDLRKQAEKVEIASQLKAENIKVYGVNSRGKEREGEFRPRQIESLKVQFNLAENKVAPIEGKDIMIRVIDPDGNVVFDVANGSGTFMLNGREEFYTAKQNILFDNTRQELVFLYDKGSEYQEGKYVVQIFADDYVIGEEPFVVK